MAGPLHAEGVELAPVRPYRDNEAGVVVTLEASGLDVYEDQLAASFDNVEEVLRVKLQAGPT